MNQILILFYMSEIMKNKENKQKIEVLTIPEKLIEAGACSGYESAKTSMCYAINWMMGQKFDLKKTQVQMHRKRLLKIGMDISKAPDFYFELPFTIEKPVVIETCELSPPSFYRHPEPHLKAVS